MNNLVSVLMSVHNEPAGFIDVAVKSICNQTYPNIEFVIIDDNSDEETYQHLRYLSEEYKIIRLYRNEENLGLTRTLNKGLSICTGDYIARMDADDYSCHQRIEKQVAYFEAHPDIEILGTGVVSFGQEVKFMSPINGYNPQDVQSNLFFSSSLCHPSVIIRKSFLDRTGLTYDESVKKGQDYDLWERASVYGNLAVLPDVLLYYRIHNKQITITNREDQDQTLQRVMLRRLQRIGISPNRQEILCHLALMGQVNTASIDEIKAWVNKVVSHSIDCKYIDTPILHKNLKQRYVLAKLKKHIMPDFDDSIHVLQIMFHRFRLRYKLYKIKKRIGSKQ